MKVTPYGAILILLTTVTMATDVPSSARSRSAIQRVKPALDADLRAQRFNPGSPIFIRIFKESRELELWIERGGRFELFRIYEICTFSGGLGPKLRTGDRKSPEGFYFVTPGRMNPASRFHLSFNLGFPNAYDRAHGRTGSALMVHGDCVSIGCYAMTNGRIEEIYALADAALGGGQPFFRVHVFPFRMTQSKLAQHEQSRWASFWRNLREGYDYFETNGRPPNVEVANKRYTFD